MKNKLGSDEEFMRVWEGLRSAQKVAQHFGAGVRSVHRKRQLLEQRLGKILKSDNRVSPTFHIQEHSARANCEIENGVVMVASDCHYWPDVVSTAHQAFCKLISEIKPALVVMNGDLFDGAGISRFPKSSYTRLPTVKEELEAVNQRLAEIRKAAPPGTKFWWTLGNHDMRFEARLVSQVPEYEGVQGFTLKDHFPEWPMSMSLFINRELMIKHRFRAGVHATWNNTLYSGTSICTGHLHRLQATIMTDYNGTRWGIDCGTLADVDGSHMHYGEDNPTNHCSGFAVLTIVDGTLLHPEFCTVVNGRAYFRGKEV
jgi:UDP-2,3-diacylglucosamine pyrophosphatase LpxH